MDERFGINIRQQNAVDTPHACERLLGLSHHGYGDIQHDIVFAPEEGTSEELEALQIAHRVDNISEYLEAEVIPENIVSNVEIDLEDSPEIEFRIGRSREMREIDRAFGVGYLGSPPEYPENDISDKGIPMVSKAQVYWSNSVEQAIARIQHVSPSAERRMAEFGESNGFGADFNKI